MPAGGTAESPSAAARPATCRRARAPRRFALFDVGGAGVGRAPAGPVACADASAQSAAVSGEAAWEVCAGLCRESSCALLRTSPRRWRTVLCQRDSWGAARIEWAAT